MTPISLTLKGFRGIRDGLGRDELHLDLERLADGAQLVAIAGPNGRGKTTVMDNMHPYLTMPSRAAVAGPGGFSYYDHLYLPENEKDLVWTHDGSRYRSQIVFRLNGKRKTEAFLFKQGERGWEPLRQAGGVVSDGKVDTYERCVEAILGSAETFFTSVFSAQGKRQLTAYRNAEIKSLLGDLLGLDEIRVMGLRAGETARLLKAGLAAMRHGQAGLESEARRIESERIRFGDAGARVAAAAAARQAVQQGLDTSRAVQAQLAAERTVAQRTELRRAELLAERQALIQSGRDAAQSLDAQETREIRRLAQLAQRMAGRAEQAASRLRTLEGQRTNLETVLARAGAVARAGRRQALAARVVAARAGAVAQLRLGAQRLAELQGGERTAMQKMAAVEREAGQAALRAAELAKRFGLTKEVPCFGTDLQGRCQLLGDAREARTLMPSANFDIAKLSQKKSAVNAELADLCARRATLAESPARLDAAELRLERARTRSHRFAVLAGQSGEIGQARAALSSLERELSAIHDASAGGETAEEIEERQQIAVARQAIVAQRERHATQSRQALQRIESAIAALPAPYDEQRFLAAARAAERAAGAVTVAERAHVVALRDAQSLDVAERQASEMAVRKAAGLEIVASIEAELGNWTLFAKCLSNDGVIALAIDEAGPVLAGLANDLLQASYGARFTVSIRTLVATGKGEQREGFDIVVHDAESSESKSVGLMSGGERTWIEACLVRAIALYLAQNAGRRYTTLFSDEADGPLDPERKRMFMAMKREVLRLGGYAREFFVSQAPELTAAADVVIDMDVFCVARHRATVAAGNVETIP